MDFVTLTNLVWHVLGGTWHEARIECLMERLRGIWTSQSIHTARLAARRKKGVPFESHAPRIRRFLAEPVLDGVVSGRLLLRMAGVAGQKRFTVVVARTNGDFGKSALNFLVLGVVVDGIGVPVVWAQLGQQGNRQTGERLALLERFLKSIPAAPITVFLAGREFLGRAWLEALPKRRIPYAMRVRNNQFVTLAGGRPMKLAALAQERIQPKPRTWTGVDLEGVSCTFSLKRLPEKDLLAVVSFGREPSADPLETYRRRWAIERCFSCLKTKGFHLESTHLGHPERLEKMFALASLAAAAALAASPSQRKTQPRSRRSSTPKKSTATPHDRLSSAA
jgi:hypothetical protein